MIFFHGTMREKCHSMLEERLPQLKPVQVADDHHIMCHEYLGDAIKCIYGDNCALYKAYSRKLSSLLELPTLLGDGAKTNSTIIKTNSKIAKTNSNVGKTNSNTAKTNGNIATSQNYSGTRNAEEVIRNIYMRANPSKVDEIPRLLAKYNAKYKYKSPDFWEQALVDSICQKYNISPVPQIQTAREVGSTSNGPGQRHRNKFRTREFSGKEQNWQSQDSRGNRGRHSRGDSRRRRDTHERRDDHRWRQRSRGRDRDRRRDSRIRRDTNRRYTSRGRDGRR